MHESRGLGQPSILSVSSNKEVTVLVNVLLSLRCQLVKTDLNSPSHDVWFYDDPRNSCQFRNST